MPKIAVVLSILSLAFVACGGRETATTEGSQAPAAVGSRPEAAPPAAAPAAQAPAPEATGGTMQAESAQSQKCLDLVAAAQWQQALPICIAALDANPNDAKLKAAVDQARAETAKMAAAGAAAQSAAGEAAAGAASEAQGAAQGAVEGAAGSAKGAVDEAAKGMSEKLGQ